MVFFVGWAVFCNPSFNTPGITLGINRSAVLGLLPMLVRYISVPLNTSPPTFRSHRKLRFQFLYRILFKVPRENRGFLSPIGRKVAFTTGKPVEGLIRISPLLFRV